MTTYSPTEVVDNRLSKEGDGWTLRLGYKTVYNIGDDDASLLREAMISAINGDRARTADGFTNTLAKAAHDVLSDRETAEAELAAEWVRENENDQFWDSAGSFIDGLEKKAASA